PLLLCVNAVPYCLHCCHPHRSLPSVDAIVAVLVFPLSQLLDFHPFRYTSLNIREITSLSILFT
ncbi:MAG: hypothetical protein ACRDL7_10730, partial [Gaiellaceae bacterium]